MDARFPVEIWSHGDRYTAEIVVTRPVIGARLWPDPNVPDWDATNDVWGSAPQADRQAASTAGGVVPPIAGNPHPR